MTVYLTTTDDYITKENSSKEAIDNRQVKEGYTGCIFCDVAIYIFRKIKGLKNS